MILRQSAISGKFIWICSDDHVLGYGGFITVVKSHRIFARKDITLGASKQNKLNPQP